MDKLQTQILQVQNEINLLQPTDKMQLQEKQLKLEQLQFLPGFLPVHLSQPGGDGDIGCYRRDERRPIDPAAKYIQPVSADIQ